MFPKANTLGHLSPANTIVRRLNSWRKLLTWYNLQLKAGAAAEKPVGVVKVKEKDSASFVGKTQPHLLLASDVKNKFFFLFTQGLPDSVTKV